VFRPPPNVDSALISFRRKRQWGREYEHVKFFVRSAFAHRRKTLVNSQGLVGMERELAEGVLEQMGFPPDVRAERLSPEDYLRLTVRR
jgi:16S rRNA (adenine1518-N6/adenine1519-N6)-dimethyltransferase